MMSAILDVWEQCYSSLLKRTKTLSRFIEVDFITKMMSWSYIFMPHSFCVKSHLVGQRLTEDNKLSAPNVLKSVYSFS